MKLITAVIALTSFVLVEGFFWWTSNPWIPPFVPTPQENPPASGQTPNSDQNKTQFVFPWWEFIPNHAVKKRAAGYPQFAPLFNNGSLYSGQVGYIPPYKALFVPPVVYQRRNASQAIRDYKMNWFGPRITKRAVPYPPPYHPPYECIRNNPNCSGTHDLYSGCSKAGDTLLFAKRFKCSPPFLNIFGKSSKTILYPKPGYMNQFAIITAVHVIDQNCHGNGGHAEILDKTGVGYRNASIRLYSGKAGCNFDIYIYGGLR